MKIKGARVLVTGAGGFIGSHLVEALLKRGAEVKAFIRYNASGSWGRLELLAPEILKSIEVVSGDVRDFHSLKEAMKGCAAVFHLAALVSIPFSYRSPESYVDTNVKGTLNVVQAARDLGTGKVIHTSTSEVYGTALRVPIDESHPLQGQSPYSASKIGADQIALSFFRSFNVPVTVLRPFNTYGPRQSARAVIPNIITQAQKSDDITLGSTDPTRDFSFIDDTASGFIAAAESEKTTGETINLGTGYEISIGDLVKVIGEVMGRKLVVKSENERLRPSGSEVFRLLSDNSLASKLMDWRPEYGGRKGLKLGLKKTAEWFAIPEHQALFKPGIYNI